MDACAPAPSCGNVPNNASDIWFKFYASSATAHISCFQNTSLVIGVQAFSGGPVCGSLSEIGCALAGGPSSGVQLNLSGLSPGVLYYFRIFGSANPVSQRTGLYCFCGSTGLGIFLILPVRLTDFSGLSTANKINISWTVDAVAAMKILKLKEVRTGSHLNGLPLLPENPIPGCKPISTQMNGRRPVLIITGSNMCMQTAVPAIQKLLL